MGFFARKKGESDEMKSSNRSPENKQVEGICENTM
jgi:hypothetical protein